jgi:ABC-type Fe3+-hydroxamate transport system substrate-binding protein
VATARLKHPTVVWPFSYRPVMVVGGGSFMSELLDVAGARNIYRDLPQPSPVVTLEDVVRRNPQDVIRSVDETQTVTQPKTLDPAWMALPAVRMGHVITAPAELVARPSVRLGEAAVALARLLHPGITIQ